MAPNSPACSFIQASMAGSRSTAPSNRSNSVLIISLLSAFESCGYVTEGLPVIRPDWWLRELSPGLASISAAFAPRGSPRGFLQADTLVAIIGHAQVGALVIRELEADGLNWFTARIEYNQQVPFTDIKPIDFKTLPLRPLLHWSPVDSDLKPVRIYLTIWKGRRLFPKRIIDPRRNADTARASLRRPEIETKRTSVTAISPVFTMSPNSTSARIAVTIRRITIPLMIPPWAHSMVSRPLGNSLPQPLHLLRTVHFAPRELTHYPAVKLATLERLLHVRREIGRLTGDNMPAPGAIHVNVDGAELAAHALALDDAPR